MPWQWQRKFFNLHQFRYCNLKWNGHYIVNSDMHYDLFWKVNCIYFICTFVKSISFVQSICDTLIRRINFFIVDFLFLYSQELMYFLFPLIFFNWNKLHYDGSDYIIPTVFHQVLDEVSVIPNGIRNFTICAQHNRSYRLKGFMFIPYTTKQ